MQLRPNEEELPALKTAAKELKQANAAAAAAEKSQESAKKVINDWLLQKRQIDVNQLAIGSHVTIEGVVLFKVGEMRKFDELSFKAQHPALHTEFMKGRRVKRYDPLIQ